LRAGNRKDNRKYLQPAGYCCILPGTPQSLEISPSGPKLGGEHVENLTIRNRWIFPSNMQVSSVFFRTPHLLFHLKELTGFQLSFRPWAGFGQET